MINPQPGGWLDALELEEPGCGAADVGAVGEALLGAGVTVGLLWVGDDAAGAVAELDGGVGAGLLGDAVAELVGTGVDERFAVDGGTGV